ncbi:MAG: SurA N-terminal domain-containing protein [Pyrinomonadaceae bacterium]|nr:SurA N-terminal domain-containing protein [Pyrinomonadaceae bacterium]
MKRTVNFEGVKARVRNFNFKIFSIAFLAITAFVLNACTGASTSSTPLGGNVDVNETAATVNGKVIKLQEVERVIKQQGGGQEGKLSPLELAQARLQVLESLIQQEVMFQKAEKEKTVPTDEEVTAELNKRKTASGISQEEFDKKMKEAGETDASIRETIKRGLAIQKLTEKITNKIEPPKDSEIDAFYVGNKEAFVKKKGVKIAAIVIDPKVIGEGDTTTNEQEAVLKAKELFAKVQQPASDFAAIARENSEDQSRLQGGDLGYLSQEELSQGFSPQLAAGLMDPRFPVGQVTGAQAQGKYFIIKLQERSDKDENLTLESPGIRQQVTDSLINARKQLLAASFQSLAMDEAKIENYLARKVVENPNELSGARPAGAATTPTPANTDANTANTNANVSANSNANTKTNANANANANTKANTNSNTK